MADLSLTKSWTYLAATTFERIAPFIADNITSRIFLLHILNESGMKQEVQGGLQLIFPVFKELPTASAYTDLDTLSVARANPTTVARYNWKQVAAPVTISGRDMVINSGSDVAITNVLTHFIEASEAAMREALDDATTGIHSTNDETSSGVTGLQNLITSTASATPTSGTAGGLDRSTFTFWRNNVVNVASTFATTGYAGMHNLYLQCTRGDETPDVIELTRSTYLNFLRNSTTNLRYNVQGGPMVGNTGLLDVGWSAVSFLGAIMGYDDNVPANVGYFLNSKYVHYVVHPQRNIELGPFVMPVSQDAITAHIYWAGNLCMSNMSRQGLLLNGDTN